MGLYPRVMDFSHIPDIPGLFLSGSGKGGLSHTLRINQNPPINPPNLHFLLRNSLFMTLDTWIFRTKRGGFRRPCALVWDKLRITVNIKNGQ